MVRALASHQCGLGSIPGPSVICGLSLLLVLSLMCIGEQGRRRGESARLPPVWPGCDSQTRRHMWVEKEDITIFAECTANKLYYQTAAARKQLILLQTPLRSEVG